jgi:hypothetical protein
MNIQNIVNRELGALGGHLDASWIAENLPEELGSSLYYRALDLPKYFSSAFDAPQEDELKSIYDRLHCCLVNSLNLNAYAFKSEDFYFIGLNAGSVLVIEDAFSTLLSHPSVLPEVGNVSAEAKAFDEIPAGFPIVNALSLNDPVATGRRCNRYAPKDPIRWHYAQCLTNCALDFLMRHELGHILYGHVDYLERTGQRALLPELDLESESPLSTDVLQMMELQADSFASECYASLLGNPRLFNTISFMLQKGLTLAELIRGKLFSIAILFRLFAQVESRADYSRLDATSPLRPVTRLEEKSHPRSVTRFQTCRTIQRIALKRDRSGEVLKTFEDVSTAVLRDVQDIWCRFKLPGRTIEAEEEIDIKDFVLTWLMYDVAGINAFSPVPAIREKSSRPHHTP